jgi:type IV pilus assembly protein PilO
MAINLEELKKLSPKFKALILCLVCILIGYLDYMLFLQDSLTRRATLDTKLTELQRQVAEKERTVAEIGKYMREVNVLQVAFKQALLKLPNEREIAGLLASVVLSGKSAGVNFLLFEPKPREKTPLETKPAAPKPPQAKPGEAKGQPPKPAVPEKFYDEIPIKVQFSGGFHNTISFFEQVAKLSRIVNIEDIVVGDSEDVKGRGRIVKTSCTVKTYMFVDRK